MSSTPHPYLHPTRITHPLKAILWKLSEPENYQAFLATSFCYVLLQLSSVLDKKNPDPTILAFEQREVLLNNIDHSVDARNSKYQNMQKYI